MQIERRMVKLTNLMAKALCRVSLKLYTKSRYENKRAYLFVRRKLEKIIVTTPTLDIEERCRIV